MTKPTFDTHDPNNFIEFTLFRNYNLKPIVNEIIKKRQSQKNHDPFVYFDNNEIVRIIKSKYTNRQIKDLKRRYRSVVLLVLLNTSRHRQHRLTHFSSLPYPLYINIGAV